MPPHAMLTAARCRALAPLLLAAACGGEARPSSVGPAATAPAAGDAYAPAAMAARFQRGVPERPTQLGGGATTSVDSLLARWARGVAARDTSALAPLALTVSEFAWLYYVDSPLAQPPYELDPEMLWMQTASRSARGLARTLATYGGRPLGAWRPACAPPRVAGALRLHTCAVTFRPAGAAAEVRLPLSVVERDGRFKLVGFGTSL